MDFTPTPEEKSLCERLRNFAASELNPGVQERDASGTFDLALWKKCADAGVLGLFIPEPLAGSGFSTCTTILALEALGYGCEDNGLTLALNGQIWSVQEPLLKFGSEEQKQAYLPKLCRGEMIAAHAMTEPKAGSDAFSLKSTAKRDGDDYILNGEKCLLGLAPVSDLALVFASTNPAAGKWGISAFLVETSLPGVERGPACSKMGLRTAPLGEMRFKECRVPAKNRLGPEGAGLSIFNHSMLWERSFIFTSHVGAMRRQLESSLTYARERQVFGQPIANFQAVSNRLAEMKLRLEVSRLLLYQIAWLKDREQSVFRDAAVAKTYISEAYVSSSLDAVRIHGGQGYLAEREIERHLRDSLGGVIYSGTNEVQRNLIARLEDS